MKTLKDQHIIITGGGSGIGAATAKYLSQSGAKLSLWDMNEDTAAALAAEIGAHSAACDVTDGGSVEDALTSSIEKFGGPRVLINCAGILIGKRLAGKEGSADLEHFTKVLQVNLTGTYNTMRLVAGEMIKLDPQTESGERGVIINTASIAAFEGQIGQMAYAASKGGVVSMTLPAARELGKFGIRVMTIAPGAVSTPMMDIVPDHYREAIEAGVPFPSRFAQSEEYASLAKHIIENEYLNGETIRLDGAARLQPK